MVRKLCFISLALVLLCSIVGRGALEVCLLALQQQRERPTCSLKMAMAAAQPAGGHHTPGEELRAAWTGVTTSPAPLVWHPVALSASDGFRAEYKTFADTSPCYLYWQCNIKTMGSTDSDFLHIDNAAATSILIVRRDAVTRICQDLGCPRWRQDILYTDQRWHDLPYWLEYTTGGTVNLFVFRQCHQAHFSGHNLHHQRHGWMQHDGWCGVLG